MANSWRLVSNTEQRFGEIMEWFDARNGREFFKLHKQDDQGGPINVEIGNLREDRQNGQWAETYEDLLNSPATIDLTFWLNSENSGRQGRIDEVYKLAFDFCDSIVGSVHFGYEGQSLILRRGNRIRINRTAFTSVSRRSMLPTEFELSPWPYSYLVQDGWPESGRLTERQSAQRLLDLHHVDNSSVSAIVVDRLSKRIRDDGCDDWWSERFSERDSECVRSWLLVSETNGSLNDIVQRLGTFPGWKPLESDLQTPRREILQSADGDIVLSIACAKQAVKSQNWITSHLRPNENVVLEIALNLNSESLGRYDEIYSIVFEIAKWDDCDFYFYVDQERCATTPNSWVSVVARHNGMWSIFTHAFEPDSLAKLITCEHDLNYHHWNRRKEFLTAPIDPTFPVLTP